MDTYSGTVTGTNTTERLSGMCKCGLDHTKSGLEYPETQDSIEGAESGELLLEI